MTIHISSDLLEEIFLALPLKSIVRCKTVSKEWRSILESERFAERRMKVPKKRKILAAHNCKNCGDPPSLLPESNLAGDEEIVYLHCDARKPPMSCDGLVCFPGPDWINVVNPSTGQFRRFHSELDLTSSQFTQASNHFLGNWVFGFGKDRVTGSYKVVKMCVFRLREKQSHVLDVASGGQWKKLTLLPPCVHGLARESVCVNGSIYWFSSRLLQVGIPADYTILSLDLHTEEFHYISVPPTLIMRDTQVVNLQDRLAVANNRKLGDCWMLEISTMKEEIWSLTYSINLSGLEGSVMSMLFKPVAVSKQGNLVFCNEWKSLYKYYPETCEVQCLSSDIRVISSYIENLVPLGSGHHPYPIRTCTNRRLYPTLLLPDPGSKDFKFGIQEAASTATLLVMAGFVLVSLQLFLTTTHKWWKEKSDSNERLVLFSIGCVIAYLFF